MFRVIQASWWCWELVEVVVVVGAMNELIGVTEKRR